MQGYVMKCSDTHTGRYLGYLQWWDLDSHVPGYPTYPTGVVEVTQDIDKAHLFASMEEAMETWRRQSKAVPLRPDGKPNRPLTAFTVEVIPKEAGTSHGSMASPQSRSEPRATFPSW